MTRPSRSTSTPTSPATALNEAQKYGTLELAKIENMRTQADDLAAGQKAQSTDDLDAVEAELERGEAATGGRARKRRYGFLAVCAGDGLAAVFRDLGVDAYRLRRADHEPLHREQFWQEVDQTPS